MQKFKQNETTATYRRIYMFLASPADGYTPVTSLSGATVNLFRNGVAFGSQPLTPATLTHISVGHWYYEIPQIYLSDLGILTVTVSDTNIRPVVLMAEVLNYDWMQPSGATAAQVWAYADRQLTASLDPTATQIWSAATRTLTGPVTVSGNVTVGGFTVGAISSSAFANSAINLRLANDPLPSSARFTTYDSFSGYPLLSQSAQHQVSITGSHHAAADVHEFQPNVLTSTATDATFVNELVDAVWDELLSTHTTTGSAGKRLLDLASVYTGITGVVTSAVNATYSTFSTNLTAIDETYDEQTIVFTTGNCAGQSVPITEYLQTNGRITTEDPFTSEPQPGDVFSIIPIHIHKRTQIADTLLNRLLDSSGSSSDVMNERTVRSALRAMRNKIIVNAGTMTVYKEDDDTPAWEGTLSNTVDVTVNPDGGNS